MTNFSFDADDIEIEDSKPVGEWAPLPVAAYNCECIDAEYETIDKGEYIAVKWEVSDGEHAGQWIWDKIFMEGGYFDDHAKVGKQNLAKILKYSGLGKIKKEVFELVGAKVNIKIKHSPNKTDPGKVFVNVAFYNQLRKGAAKAAAAAPAKPAAPAPAFEADEDDAPF